MRTIMSVMLVLAASISAVAVCSSSSGCSSAQKTAEGSAAACLGVDITQTVKADGVSIVADIYKAVVSGGAALPQLIADLIGDFGPQTAQCASIVVDAIDGVTPNAGSGNATLVAPSPGGLALKAEMKKRGWPTK